MTGVTQEIAERRARGETRGPELTPWAIPPCQIGVWPTPDGTYEAHEPVYETAQTLTSSSESASAATGDEGRKNDTGKLPLHLLPFDALEAVTEVLDCGQKIYSPRNWEKGMHWSRVFGAMLRHAFKWWQGQKADPETGLSHMAHAACCALFLLAYEKRQVGTDDRP